LFYQCNTLSQRKILDRKPPTAIHQALNFTSDSWAYFGAGVDQILILYTDIAFVATNIQQSISQLSSTNPTGCNVGPMGTEALRQNQIVKKKSGVSFFDRPQSFSKPNPKNNICSERLEAGKKVAGGILSGNLT